MTRDLLPLEQFYYFEKQNPQKIFMKQPFNNEWRNYSWFEVGEEARKMAQTLRKLNLPEKSCIAMLSKNCAHWIIADLAIWMAGHISVPLYPTLTANSIKEILSHSDAQLIFAGKLDDWKSQKEGVAANLPKICFPLWQNEGCISWNEFVGDVQPLKENVVRGKDDIATIIYTSGTTGKPKGVVHSFESISFPMIEAVKVLKISLDDKFLSYLPLSHIAERLLVQLGGIYTGGTISFVESLDTFTKNLQETNPTIFLAVPRIWTKFQLGVLEKIPQKKLDVLLSIPILNSIIRNKIKKKLGLMDVRIPITGAAPISKDVLIWFKKIGIEIQEVYGMTENFGFATYNFPGKIKYGTVGCPWNDSEIKIGENKEILTRSKATMKAYYKEPALTSEVMTKEGWLHTGDQGELTPDGYLKIVGRVKDLFKTAKGKYVAPSPIEALFSKSELVEQVCIMGEGIPQPIGVVVLSEIGKVKSKEELTVELSFLLGQINKQIEQYEQLKTIVATKEEWNMANGLLTPTLKIKRAEIERKYASQMGNWYESKKKIVFIEGC